jgi:hypothetical protein
MKSRWTLRIFLLGAALLGLLAAASPAFAHGKTTIGDYDIEIGFHNEPAYLGQPNSLDLIVTNNKTNQRVNGLEKTLKAELVFGGSKTEIPIYPQDGVDGAYGADVIPTAEGDYTWHISGKINGTPVDVSLTSAPDTFSSVEAMSKYEFPRTAPSIIDLQAQVAAANRTAVIGVGLGAVGVLLGLVGLLAAVRASRK